MRLADGTQFTFLHCHHIIELGGFRRTYCMLPEGHEGKCDAEPSPDKCYQVLLLIQQQKDRALPELEKPQ